MGEHIDDRRWGKTYIDEHIDIHGLRFLEKPIGI